MHNQADIAQESLDIKPGQQDASKTNIKLNRDISDNHESLLRNAHIIANTVI